MRTSYVLFRLGPYLILQMKSAAALVTGLLNSESCKCQCIMHVCESIMYFHQSFIMALHVTPYVKLVANPKFIVNEFMSTKCTPQIGAD